MRLAFLLFLPILALGQQQGPNVTAQREAMKKLSFLVGKWSGDASVVRGPGPPTKVRQTEEVQYKLDGLILLIEGTGRDPQSGAVKFNAMAVVSFDEETSTYRFRSYNDGRYLDTELKVPDKGFEWGYKAGPADVRFIMKLNDKGEWVEMGEVSINGNPPRRNFEMTVRRQ